MLKLKRFNDVKEFYMKKLIISIMAVMLFLTGCGKSQEKATLERISIIYKKKIKELKDKKESFNKKRKISR